LISKKSTSLSLIPATSSAFGIASAGAIVNSTGARCASAKPEELINQIA